MEVKDYEMVNGLLHRIVLSSDGEMTTVPVIPDVGARAVVLDGTRRVLTWRNMILHTLHNSTAGGHVGMHALEHRVTEVAWWKGLARDCRSWCMRCVSCRAIKGQVHGSAFSRSERYTAPFRALQVDLVGPLSPESQECDYIVTTLDMFSPWVWLSQISGKSPEVVAGVLYRYVCLGPCGFPSYLEEQQRS